MCKKVQDHELTTIKNVPPNVIMQNYLVSCDTPRHFDSLYILQTVFDSFWITSVINLRRNSSQSSELVANPHTPRDATAQFSSV